MRYTGDVEHAFSSVKITPAQGSRVLRTEIAFKDLALEMMQLLPESADRTAALRKLLETKHACVQAITHEAPAEEAGQNGNKNKKGNVHQNTSPSQAS